MNEEQQNRFNKAIFWKARQKVTFNLNPEPEVIRLLAEYRDLELSDRLALLEEYDNRQDPTPSTAVATVSLSALIKRLLRK